MDISQIGFQGPHLTYLSIFSVHLKRILRWFVGCIWPAYHHLETPELDYGDLFPSLQASEYFLFLVHSGVLILKSMWLRVHRSLKTQIPSTFTAFYTFSGTLI